MILRQFFCDHCSKPNSYSKNAVNVLYIEYFESVNNIIIAIYVFITKLAEHPE